VLGGAIGGVVGVFTGVLGVGKGGQGQTQAPAASGAKQSGPAGPAKSAKAGKGGKETRQAVLTQDGEPQLTAEQIVANSDANIERIKNELKLTPPSRRSTGPDSTARCITSATTAPIASTCELPAPNAIRPTT